MSDPLRFVSKTQRRILDLLSDGEAHTREEIHACLPDNLSTLMAARQQIYRLNKLLKEKDEVIVCVLGRHRRLYYRHFPLLKSRK